MAAFLLTTFSILSILYIIRLKKFKFKNENREKIKTIHSIAYLVITIPFITLLLAMLLNDPVITITTTIVYGFLYILYRKLILKK